MTEFILPMLATLLIVSLAIMKHHSSWRELQKWQKMMFYVIPLLALGSIWVELYQNDIRESKSELRAENLTNQLQKTREQLSTLQLSSDIAQNSLDSLLKLYEPLVTTAKEYYPDLSDADAIKTLLAKIDKNISASRPKLAHARGKDKTGVVKATGLSFHRFVFESKPPGILRNQKLFLQFDKKIDSADLKIFGGIVVKQGNRISVSSDSMSVSCFVDLLRADNSLFIEITSTSEILLTNVRIN